ncbi:MAG: hypothetical protein QOF37_933 [Thermoleophilaceae bacterium]|jgi:hypothetical protein|nr:hypothetical protein [Thermoleophilaceae bacterium]
MADRTLFMSWGAVVRGREERAVEVFNESVGYWGRAQQEGRIDAFDVRLMVPNAKLDGYIEIRGSAEQLAAVKEDPGYKRLMIDSSLIIEDMHICEGFANEAVAEQMALYQEAVAKVPQTA